MGSTSSPPGRPRGFGRRQAGVAMAGLLAGCAAVPQRPAGPMAAPVLDGAFLMPDGMRLPFRVWEPAGPPDAIVLALHGFADSRDAWELPGPVFAAAGLRLVAPDQRGFGETASRGRWSGAAQMTLDAASVLRQLRRIDPYTRIFVMGESMGGAVAMRLAALRPPEPAGYVLLAPAVWGRAGLNLFLRTGLWVLSRGLPAVTIWDGGPVRVKASDNVAALRRLTRDPLTLHGTRFDTLRGMVDLMDDAVAAAPLLPAPTLALYGGHDEVIPPTATAAMWRELPSAPAARRLFYPDGYHLLLRDLGRAGRTDDILAWMRDPAVPLPAETAAATWLAKQP